MAESDDAEAADRDEDAEKAQDGRRDSGLLEIHVRLHRACHDDDKTHGGDGREDRQDRGEPRDDEPDGAENLGQPEKLDAPVRPRRGPLELLRELQARKGDLEHARREHHEGDQALGDPKNGVHAPPMHGHSPALRVRGPPEARSGAHPPARSVSRRAPREAPHAPDVAKPAFQRHGASGTTSLKAISQAYASATDASDSVTSPVDASTASRFCATSPASETSGWRVASAVVPLQPSMTHAVTARADLIAFARPYISNPDLAERIRVGAPLSAPRKEYFYGDSAVGYVDYPFLTNDAQGGGKGGSHTLDSNYDTRG